MNDKLEKLFRDYDVILKTPEGHSITYFHSFNYYAVAFRSKNTFDKYFKTLDEALDALIEKLEGKE